MRVNGQQLGGLLARELLGVYLVAGDEPLLVSEAAAQIRARARRDGFEQRDYFVVERGFDWQALTEGADNLSLFASRRIIELNLPKPQPGAAGGRALRDLAQRPDPDRLLLIVTRKLDASASRSAWVRAIDDGGAVIRVWPVERPQLPGWIRRRAQSRGLRLSSPAAEWMADRVEGNLLAADQEVQKLVLLLGDGTADDAAVRDAVASNPRFDVFRLTDALLAGQAKRALRILDGLRAEGAAPSLVLWAISRDLGLLSKLKFAARNGALAAPVLKRHGVWPRRQPLVKGALDRIESARLTELIVQAAETDRVIKGVQPGNAWHRLTSLVLAVLGRPGHARSAGRPARPHTGRAPAVR